VVRGRPKAMSVRREKHSSTLNTAPGECVLFMPQGESLADASRASLMATAMRRAGLPVIIAGRGRILTEVMQRAGLSVVDHPDFGVTLSRAVENGDGMGRQFWDIAGQLLEADVRLFRTLRPAVVVGDCHPTLRLSTRVAEVPYVSVMGVTWTRAYIESELRMARERSGRMDANGQGSGQPRVQEAMLPTGARRLDFSGWNQLAESLGVESYGYPCDVHRGDVNLIADCSELVPELPLEPDCQFIGPLVWSGRGRKRARRRRGRPLVYATFGSSAPRGLIERVALGLGRMPEVDAWITVGLGAHERTVPKARNVKVVRVAAGNSVAAQADVVVCHGGLGSLYQAAAGGTPILGIAPSLEQHWNVGLFARWGCALQIAPELADSPHLHGAIRTLLSRPEYARRAHDLEVILQRYDAPSRSARAVLTVMEHANASTRKSSAISVDG